MKKIGEGLQYLVYDLGNGRVLKKPKSIQQQKTKLLSWGYVLPEDISRKIDSINKMGEESVAHIKSISNHERLSFIGNPVYLEGLEYEQDKGIPVKEYFETCTEEQRKRVVDEFIQTILKTWKLKFSEMTCNFHLNHAIDKGGSVFLADLGELIVDRNEALERVREQKWRGCWGYDKYLSGDLKKYFEKEMKRFITEENFNKFWK